MFEHHHRAFYGDGGAEYDGSVCVTPFSTLDPAKKFDTP
jgi:hypothetical protein